MTHPDCTPDGKPTHGDGRGSVFTLAPQTCRTCGTALVIVKGKDGEPDTVACPRGCTDTGVAR